MKISDFVASIKNKSNYRLNQSKYITYEQNDLKIVNLELIICFFY